MNKRLFEETIRTYSQDSEYQKEWYIISSENTKTHHPCICGHNVKRITYIYNKITKHIMIVGTTCIKKYGIKQHLKNGILVVTIKHILQTTAYTMISDNIIVIPDFHTILNDAIQAKFSEFQEKINVCISNNIDIDYYDIIAPFRRLLNDVCYLVTEYHYDFMILLKEIETNVNAMNDTVKHIIIDETKEDMSEESLSESSEEPIYPIVETSIAEEEESIPIVETSIAEEEESIPIVETSIAEEESIHIVETSVQEEEPMIVEHIHINEESVNIEADHIFFTIMEDQDDIFVCRYCDASFFTQDDNETHEKICMDNHSIIDSEQNIDEIKSEIEDSHHTEIIVYEDDAVLERYCNYTTDDLKCTFCIRSIDSYCNCEMRYRLYQLAIEISELRKDINEFSIKTSKLLEETQELRWKYCSYASHYIR